MYTILLVIGILVVLIVAHELGHFIAAKMFGVRVQEFGVGYPPRAFLFAKFGGTEYTLNWLPLGGFVRLFGDEGEAERGPGSFVDASKPVQAIILVAGVLANAILAWALFAGALSYGIPRVVDAPIPNGQTQLVVADVVLGSPAEAGGLTAGDEILSVEDSKGLSPTTLSPEQISAFVQERGGQQVSFTYARAGATSTTTIRPAHAVIAEQAGRPAVGVALVLVNSGGMPWRDAMYESLFRTRDAFISVGTGLWGILREALSGHPNLSGIVGPVGLVNVVSDAASHGIGNVLALAGFISVNLVIINLIPFPVLDGGRLLLLAVETMRRRSAPRITVQLLNILGVVLIALLMITVTYNDIARLFS